jgi:hypothetical protein
VSSKRVAKPVPFDVAKVEDLITSRKFPPDEEQYLRERWLERIRWWDHRATTTRRKFLTSRCIVVVGGVLIPFLTSEAVRLPGNDFLNYFATFVALPGGGRRGSRSAVQLGRRVARETKGSGTAEGRRMAVSAPRRSLS